MTTSSAARNLQSEATEMRREVTLFGGISVLAGIMIGSGIFYIGAIVLQRAGMSPGLSLLVWIIGGLVTLLSGICFAELGAMIPKAGGYYVYLREAYGERIAFMCGFGNFTLSNPGSIAALAVAFAAALNSLWTIDPVAQKVIAIATVVLLTLINIRGVALGSRLQNVFMVLKMLPILLILFAGLFFGTESPDLFMIPGEMPSFGTLMSMIGFAVIATLWAYEGWTNLNNIAEEIKNPKRNIPLSLILAITGVALLYVLFNYSIFRVVPYDKIVEMVDSGNFYLGTEAANMLFGSAGMYIVGAAMILAIFSSLNGCVLAFPRMYYAMARDGAFFKPFGKLHPTYRTPMNAQIASACLAIVLIMSRTLGELTSLVALCGMIFHGMTFFSVIILRRKYPDLERPYKVWLYPIPILLICAIMIGLIANTIVNDPFTVVLGFIVPLLGLVIYEIMFRKNHDALVAQQNKDAQ
ncbi:MAG TPA: amino acid permease [Candidatus Aphodousia gallistercoris]|nr:amino acid permease [Candidatus Aphodousia gallistercoris]